MLVPKVDFCHLAIVQPASDPVNRGFVLLLALIALLGVFLLGVVLLNLARRNRRKADDARRLAERAGGTKNLDPWYEAGRRAQADEKSPRDG